MQAEKFKQMVWEKVDKDYGICPPPTKAQDGLNILIRHFLGDDYCNCLPVNREQANTEDIYEILRLYPTSNDRKEKIRERLISFVNKTLK